MSVSFSIELFPPATPAATEAFARTLDRLVPRRPDFVSLTYGAGGGERERGTAALAALLARDDLDPAAHLTCVGAARDSVDALALDWWRAGVRRLVALRGDMPDLGPFRPHPRGYAGAADLVAGLRRVADFDISVAAYPEGHPQSASLAADLDNLKRKLEAGAARAIAQYVFEADTFLRFRDRARAARIAQPLVAGILPVFDVGKVLAFSRRCGATVPDWLQRRFAGLDADPAAREQAAAEQVATLCRALRDGGVEQFHFYTLNRSSLTLAALDALGVAPSLEKAA